MPLLLGNERLFNVARGLYRRLVKLRNRLYLMLWRGRSPYANRYIWVDPRCVARKSRIASDKFRDTGKILGGDWDRDTFDFETEYPYFAAIRALTEGRRWEETQLYKNGLAKLKEGQTPLGTKSPDELLEHQQAIRALHNDIRDNGYRPPAGQTFRLGESDEVSVHITRDGEILFHDGAHRLAIAKLLGLNRMPVQVSIRHPAWDTFRRHLILQARHNKGKLYQRVPHPDLDVIGYSHDCTERMELIRPHLDRTTGRLLDIGANYGMFCHYMEDLGFDCVAVEMDPAHVELLKKIRGVFNRKFAVEEGSIFDVDLAKYGQFEVFLALNIFHHFIKAKGTHDRLADFLARTPMNCIIFEPHKAEELENARYYRNYGERDFVAFVQEHSRLGRQRRIGRAGDGRGIYKIW